MKLGLDLHGCADTHCRIYGDLTRALRDSSEYNEVHIITGQIPTKELEKQLTTLGLTWTHWFSIAQHHIDNKTAEVTFDENGRPWMEAEIWDRTKAEYCEKEGIDLMIDDSPIYGKYFTGKTVYCLQKDPRGQEMWEKIGEKSTQRP